jgi:hypothetical protein
MTDGPLARMFRHYANGTLTARLKEGLLPDRLRVLAKAPGSTEVLRSARRLNALHKEMPACSTYLEVGVSLGRTFEQVTVPFRWGVDPHARFDVHHLPHGVIFSPLESDRFFDRLPENQKFDLVFLDGLHEWRQTYRDLLNTLDHTPDHAIILIDDVVPDDEWSAIPDQALAIEKKRAAGKTDHRWQGDVFKVVLAIAAHHPELDFCVVGESGPRDNPQALVWRRGLPSPNYSVAAMAEFRAKLDQVKFGDVFQEGKIPDTFRPTREEAGIRAALTGSRAMWSRAHISDEEVL